MIFKKGGERMRGNNDSSKGRGWHGDSKGHAEAGRKGGKASSGNRKVRNGNSENSQSEK